MDPITLTAGIIILVPTSLALLVKHYREGLKKEKERTNALLKSLSQVKEAYVLEPADEKLIEECHQLKTEIFPDGVQSRFNQFNSLEEREKFVRDFIGRAASIMHVTIEEVQFYELAINNPGAYSYNSPQLNISKGIVLNRLYLLEEPNVLIETIFHELKHAVQNEALWESDVWGYSASRKAQWMSAMPKVIEYKDEIKVEERYVNPGEYSDPYNVFEAYALQVIEIDARIFAENVMDGINK